MGGIINGLVIVGAGVAIGGIVIYLVRKNHRLARGNREIGEELKTLPIDFWHSNNVVAGPTGVWVLEIRNLTEYTTNPPKKIVAEALAQADIIKVRIKEKIDTEA